MKIKDIKKYVIGFILGLSLIGGLVFAADPGSIGALFENSTGPWRLKQEAIRDGSIEGVKLKDNTLSGSKIIDGSITNDKIQGGIISEDKLSTGVQGKLNSSIDGKDVSVNNLSVNGNLKLFGELELNGAKFVKTLKIIDASWETLSPSLPNFVGKNNMSSTTIDIPNGKYVASIRLTQTTNTMGGACLIFVPNKLAIGKSSYYSYDGYSFATPVIDFLSINNYIEDIFSISDKYYDNSGCNEYICFDFSYHEGTIRNSNFSLKYASFMGYPMDNGLGTNEYKLSDFVGATSFGTQPQVYKINPGVEYLDGNIDNIYLKRIVTYNGKENASVNCKVEVQYGEFVY